MTKTADPNGWYVIRTNPQCEKKASDELRRTGVRVYLPKRTFHARNRRTGVTSVKSRPLLIGYLFIRFPDAAPNWFSVRKCQGVKDVLRWFTDEGEWRPLSIPAGIVAAYMRRQRKREFDDIVQKRRRRTVTYRKGQRVVVTDGPFQSFLAVIEKLHKNGLVDASVEIFGRPTLFTFENPDETLKVLAMQSEAA